VAERLAKGARGVLAREGLEFKSVDPKALSKARRSTRRAWTSLARS
jgi:RecB family endonuclease NucS